MKRFQRVSLCRQNPVSSHGAPLQTEIPIQMCARLLPRKAEHLVLAGPHRRQIGEACDAHAMGEPAIDGCFDKIGCEESERDGHVDLSRAAVFPLGDAVGTCRWISDEFIKPTAATRNRCHQCCPSLRTYRASVFGDPRGQKNFATPPCGYLPPRHRKSIWWLGKLDDQLVWLDLNA